MGRSKGSCLKMIACGSDSNDNEDTHQPSPQSEYKGSTDKRGWSFRKRSATHRVLNNTVEIPSSTNKEISEIVTNNLQTQPKETFTEKTTAITWIDDDTPQPAEIVISKISDTTVASESKKFNVKEDNIKITPDESVIVVIQAAVRQFLAKKQMLRVKNVVKLQAAVRGHLVRNHAVGTLKCVLAIVKMQGLVRAHQARVYSETKPMNEEASVTKPRVEYISIEKLLTNRFAHQLLEVTPKTKPINIKCDPSSKSDSAWNWLERWMLVSTKEAVESPSEGCILVDAKDDNVQTTVINDNSPIPTTDVKVAAISDMLITKEISPGPLSGEIKKHDSLSEMAVSSEFEMDIEQPAKSAERSAPNPEFIPIQPKFEESSTSPSLDAFSSLVESENTIREAKVGGSECGTELSVTSALDSPDRSDMGVVDAEVEEAEFKKEVFNAVVDAEGSEDSIKCEGVDDDVKADLNTDISKDDIDTHMTDNSISVQTEKIGNVNAGAKADESAVSETRVASELEKPNLDTKEPDEKINLSIVSDQQAPATPSALASPQTQTIVSEFQTTPSSQVSVKTKRTKSDKKRSSNQKTKSSPSNPNQNSGSKSSLDGFPKDLKTSKRRNSFGKSDYADQEPRDSSSSSNLLPSYMQATESAKLKALSCSPRSSPDMVEREVHLKKRHSLPGANGKQDSPRLLHSKSQAQQGVKANGHSQERKWQR